jgi:hypothetical protein
MNFNEQFPEYQPIAEHIRRARVQKSVRLAHRIAEALMSVGRAVKHLAAASLRRPGRSPATSIW